MHARKKFSYEYHITYNLSLHNFFSQNVYRAAMTTCHSFENIYVCLYIDDINKQNKKMVLQSRELYVHIKLYKLWCS